MSSIIEDLFDDPVTFSIAKIDETIARSKRIVQESLAITRASNSKPKPFNTPNSPVSSFSNDSLNISPIKKTFSAISPKNSKDEHYKYPISDKQNLINDLAVQEKERNKEISELKAQLKSYQHLDLEETVRERKKNIQDLRDELKKHPLYEENEIIREKIKENQNFRAEAGILSEILYENKNKKEIEESYKNLYQIHQENSKKIVDDLQEIREKIKLQQAENQKTVRLLSIKLEEKVLESQLLVDHARSTSKQNSIREYKAEQTSNRSYDDKKFRRYSNADLKFEFFEYNKKIRGLKAEVKIYKKKYENLKKTLKKKRCASIETKKENSNKIKKNIIKRTIKKAEKTSVPIRKHISPLILQ